MENRGYTALQVPASTLSPWFVPSRRHSIRVKEKQFVWWALLAQLTENTKHVFLLLRRQGQRVPFTFVRETLPSLSLCNDTALPRVLCEVAETHLQQVAQMRSGEEGGVVLAKVRAPYHLG